MKKKGHAKTRLKIFIFIFVLALCLVFLLFAPFFNIKSIKVEGSSRYTAEKIIETSGIMIENGFRLRLIRKPLELRCDSEENRSTPLCKSCTVKIVFRTVL